MATALTFRNLSSILKKHPVIDGYCYIPLHAAILVHIFLTMKGTLPTTLHELFCSLVLCCIVRELETHEPVSILPELTSLDDLPDELKTKLGNLNILAYEGVTHNKVVSILKTYKQHTYKPIFHLWGSFRLLKDLHFIANLGHTISFIFQFKSFWLLIIFHK